MRTFADHARELLAELDTITGPTGLAEWNRKAQLLSTLATIAAGGQLAGRRAKPLFCEHCPANGGYCCVCGGGPEIGGEG